jgi:hypothetical protein
MMHIIVAKQRKDILHYQYEKMSAAPKNSDSMPVPNPSASMFQGQQNKLAQLQVPRGSNEEVAAHERKLDLYKQENATLRKITMT